jgi:Tol biopolymer transport system component
MNERMQLPDDDLIRAALRREARQEVADAVRRSMVEAIAATPQRRSSVGTVRVLPGFDRSSAATFRLIAASIALILLLVATLVFVAARLDRRDSPFADGLIAVAGSQGGLELLDPTGTVIDQLDTQKVAGADWSPDGRSLAYWNGLGSSWTIDILDAASGEVRTLTDGAGIENFAPAERHKIDPEALLHFQPYLPVEWSPDGSKLLAHVVDGPVVVVDLATGDVRRLNEVGTIGGAAGWSPDGTRVAWYDAPSWSNDYQLHVRTLADEMTVTIDPELPDGTGYWGTFTWSPDARRLLIGVGGSGGTYLVEVDPADGAQIAVHGAPDLDRILGWSPDGERVAWSTFGSRSAGTLWSMATDGSDARQHADGVCWGGIGWSPSGKELLYTTDCQPLSERMHVRAVSIDGGEPRILWALVTEGIADITGVAWQGLPR